MGRVWTNDGPISLLVHHSVMGKSEENKAGRRHAIKLSNLLVHSAL